ncbi:hypothetical protein [uncultured Eudoraea sp.]|uniref:hypothetical protein n=1 Tax=uncultured Eudoraea sp. TaxID=1035614 RepID=UPI00262DFA58|nr:hypothetical protein [uncultured Eudoraea sp.]
MTRKINFQSLQLTLAVIYGFQKATNTLTVQSPSEISKVQISPDEQGGMYYMVMPNSKVVIDTSYLDLEFKNQPK